MNRFNIKNTILLLGVLLMAVNIECAKEQRILMGKPPGSE
jgi:hypothetical protein